MSMLKEADEVDSVHTDVIRGEVFIVGGVTDTNPEAMAPIDVPFVVRP